MENFYGPLKGKHKVFTDKITHDIKDRLMEVYGETLPKELDREVAYIVNETYKATIRSIIED